MNLRLHYVLIVAGVALGLVACQSVPTPLPTATSGPTVEPQSTATPVVMGQSFRVYATLPLNGPNAEKTRSIDNAIKLALEQLTDSGLICDGIYKVDYQLLDDSDATAGKWTMLQEQTNAYKINADADAMAVIGPIDNGAARVAMPILNKSGIAIVNPAADYIGLTKMFAPNDPDVYFEMGKRNFMRLVPPQDTQAVAAARWAGTLGIKHVFIVTDIEQYGRGPADTFTIELSKASIEVVGRDAVDESTSNLISIANRISSSNADLIYYAGSDVVKAAQLLKQARSSGINARMMGTSLLMSQGFVDAAGDLARDVMATSFGVDMTALSPKGAQFARAYESKYETKPDSYAFTGYEAVSAVLSSARNVCQKDRVAITDALFNTLDFDGVLGKWSFDEAGDISITSFYGNTYDKGVWQLTTSLTAD